MSDGASLVSRVSFRDLAAVAIAGVRSRRLRAALSGLGIAIAIGSMVAVLGISESSKADLLATLDRLGTNLLQLGPGQTFFSEEAKLPEAAGRRVSRLDAVISSSAVGYVDPIVRRSAFISEAETNGISVLSADPSTLGTLGGHLHTGSFLDAAARRLPEVVLGNAAARRLGLASLKGRPHVLIGSTWFLVRGILEPLELAPELDAAALIGDAVARRLFGYDGFPTTIYVRAADGAVPRVRELLGLAANPQHPEETSVSRPSDALAARIAAKGAFTALFLGLGGVALVVGGVGIANVMVISVLERRSEIGLRRALGATRPHIRRQFVAESLLISTAGGLAGLLLGVAVTIGYAHVRGWGAVFPVWVFAGAPGAAVAVGVAAGLYPALRAARLSPTEALRTV